MARKSIKQFISENKTELFNRIFRLHKDLVGRVKSMNQKEIKVMIFNEPSLATWAASQGVQIASKIKL